MEIKGLSKENVEKISNKKKEADWVKNYRMDSLKKFWTIDMPTFGPQIDLNFDDIIYYKTNKADEKIESDWS